MAGWIITKDHIDNGEAEGTTGQNNTTAEHKIRANGTHFKMYDDDGNLYYEGYNMEGDGEYCEPGFEPLDQFGTPSAGCTYIEYRTESGSYEVL